MKAEDRKAWEKQQRENRIIDLAEIIFFEKGYDGATIIEIARACGYNKRSIYLYFKDKEEIFLAVVLRGLTLLTGVLEEASDAADIRDMGCSFYNFAMAYPDYLKLIMVYEAGICVYQTSEKKARTQEEGYKAKCQAATDRMADLMIHMLDRAKDQGRIQTDLTAEQLMMILWGQVLGVIQIILMRKQGFEAAYGLSHKALFDAFMDMVLAGLNVPASG